MIYGLDIVVMKRGLRFFWLVVSMLIFSNGHTQHSPFQEYENLLEPPLSYVVYKAIDSLQIDGKALEASWANCTWSDYFIDIEGDRKPKPVYKSRFKMLWSNEMLYIFAELEEPHVWANVKEHDHVVFHDNDFEVFIDPDGDTQSYFEIEVNALKTVFDLFLSKPYRNGGSALISWDAPKLNVGVSVDGTINNPDDIDNKWSVEMAIPFKSISLGNFKQVAIDGSTWRINFSRVQWDVDIENHVYQKRINPATMEVCPEHNWVWSSQGLINMHYPERWGYAIFSSSIVGSAAISTVSPTAKKFENYLWFMYYKQTAYMKDHKCYAKNLSALGVEEKYFLKGDVRYDLFLESLSNQFSASITNTLTGESWQINQLGVVSKKSNTKTIRP